MASVFYVRRIKLDSGKWVSRKKGQGVDTRYQVRYRLGGRGKPLHAGTAKTALERDAIMEMVTEELKAGRDPRIALDNRAQGNLAGTNFPELASEYLNARDGAMDEKTLRVDRAAIAIATEFLGDRPLEAITWKDIQEMVKVMAKGKGTSTVRTYMSPIRGVLDLMEAGDNPARDPRIKLPRSDKKEVDPPRWMDVEALLKVSEYPVRRVIVMLEATGMRIGETLNLTYKDMDVERSRIRVARGSGKGGTAYRRWVPVPEELMAHLYENRQDRSRVFPLSYDVVLAAFQDGCMAAGLDNPFTPHALRHRRASLRIAAGESPLLVAQELGHSQTSMTVDTYGHVLNSEPVPPKTSWVVSTYLGSNSSGGVPVVSQNGDPLA